jgi:hypothetical protein
MAIDLTNITAALQAKIDALDSNSSMNEILSLERAAQKLGASTNYDSAGDLPDATLFPDGSTVATYAPRLEGDSKLYINHDGGWDEVQTFATQLVRNWGQNDFYSISTIDAQKIPFASAGASTVPTITGFQPSTPTDQSVSFSTSTSSATQGYVSGGSMVSFPGPTTPNVVTTIKSFEYSSETPASHTGTLSTNSRKSFGFQSVENGKSYHGGGEYYDDATSVGPGAPDGYQPVSRIESFPHSSPTTSATEIGDMSFVPAPNTPSKYFTHGTAMNGIYAAYIANFQVNYTPQTSINADEIYKFPYASATPVTVSAYGTISGQDANGQIRTADANWSTFTNGYLVGGFQRGPNAPGTPVTTRIDKLPYTNDTIAAASPGSLDIARTNMACDNNDTKGYASMGYQGSYGPLGGATSEYAFATDTGSYSAPPGITGPSNAANNIGFSV